MSIESKHAYRFGFLKSEEWKDLRRFFLAHGNAECAVCGEVNWSNDIHHVKYPEKWVETKRSHIVILCRLCHDKIHSLFGNKSPTDSAWLFKMAMPLVFKEFGRDFTALDVIEAMDFVKSRKQDERRRFQSAIRRAVSEIKNYLLTSQVSKS